jgi:hypothetical protein
VNPADLAVGVLVGAGAVTVVLVIELAVAAIVQRRERRAAPPPLSPGRRGDQAKKAR